MKMRPYITFDGKAEEAIEVYKKAFNTDTIELLRFSDMPPIPGFELPEEYKPKILQSTLKIGDDFIRVSDCGPGHDFNDSQTEIVSIAVEASVNEIKHAFEVLKAGGRVGIELAHTFYSPCAGVVFDKFGIMWNLVAM